MGISDHSLRADNAVKIVGADARASASRAILSRCHATTSRLSAVPVTWRETGSAAEVIHHARCIPLRPRRLWVGVRVLPIELDQKPHQLTAYRCGPEDLWQLGQLQEPVGVPRSPIRIVAVDDPVDEVVRLPRFVQEGRDACRTVIHRPKSD